jgi:translation initiation factor 2B subunit (eIF-2B alpha/beta/delta family)
LEKFVNLTITNLSGTFTVGETVHQPNVSSSVATGVVKFANSTYLALQTTEGNFVANTSADANRTLKGASSGATANATSVNIEIL